MTAEIIPIGRGFNRWAQHNRRVLQAVERGSMHLGDLAKRTELSKGHVACVLLRLSRHGVVKQIPRIGWVAA